MSDSIQGVEGLELETGSYVVVPSEWRRDVGKQLNNLTSGTGEGDEAIWHLHNVEAADGTRVMEVADDRRAMEGTLDTTGRQFLFRSPDGDPLMAFDREGYTMGSNATLRAVSTGDVLATWEQSFPMFGNWTVEDGEGRPLATAERQWSLKSIMYPDHLLTAPGGSEVGRFTVRQSGMFYNVDVRVDESSIPPEVVLGVSYGISWAMADM